MSLGIKSLFNDMWDGAQQELQSLETEQLTSVKEQLIELSTVVARIEAEQAIGTISNEKAKLKLNSAKQASENVLLKVEGIALRKAEVIINSALQSVADLVNGALGFQLIEFGD